MYQIKANHIPSMEKLLDLYTNAGWTAYTADPTRLERAMRGSHAIYTAWIDGTLAGLLRTVGDGETILYVQDLLVKQAFRRRGIGRALLARAVGDENVRQKVLLTDSTPEVAAFYRSCGWLPVEQAGCTAFFGR